VLTSIPKIKAEYFPEILAYIYKTTRYYKAKDHNLNSHCHENIKTYKDNRPHGSIKAGHFLIRHESINFSRETLHHGVSKVGK
jgi:hypothetical protein